MKRVYHLALNEQMTQGARIALLPGDPARVPKLAHAFDPQAQELAYHREYRTYLGTCTDKPVLIVSTGIGGSSTAIAVDELAQLGVRTFIRVGTSGAIAPHLEVGDVVITAGSVRLDGASVQYAPIEYPAVAHYEIVRALVEAARRLKKRYHVGITASTATFHPGQERPDSYLGYVPRSLQGATAEWKRLGVLNYEMESATVLTLAGLFGCQAGCITGVVDKHERAGAITEEGLRLGEENAIAVAAKALEWLPA